MLKRVVEEGIHKLPKNHQRHDRTPRRRPQQHDDDTTIGLNNSGVLGVQKDGKGNIHDKNKGRAGGGGGFRGGSGLLEDGGVAEEDDDDD